MAERPAQDAGGPAAARRIAGDGAAVARRAGARAPAGELQTALSGLVLLVSMFALKWFGADGVPRNPLLVPPQHSLDAWSALSGVRWLMLATALATFASVAIHAGQRGHGAITNTAVPLAVLGAATSLALIWRVLIDLPVPAAVDEAKVGAVVGVLAAIGVWLGALESLRERARPRLPRHRQGARR
jgi:hypothetical protein